MNIEMINNQGANRSVDVDKNQYGNHLTAGSRMSTQQMGYSLDITGKVTENAAYGKEELKNVQDIALKASMTDVTLERNYKAVMSNSMSDEDFAKLCKDGVNPTNTTVEESATNLDKIKLVMAKAGQVIEGYNDDLSRKDIEAVVGSGAIAASLAGEIAQKAAEGDVTKADATKADVTAMDAVTLDNSVITAGENLLSAITNSLTEYNLSVTKENVESMKSAFEIAESLSPLSDESVKYMLINEMEPTIENIYMAEHSSGEDGTIKSNGPVYSGIATYASTQSTQKAWDQLKDQVQAVVEELAGEVNIENEEAVLSDAKWLVEHQIPLTKDTLQSYEQIKEVILPADSRTIIDAMAVAIEEGKEPVKGDFTKTESLYKKAVDIWSDFGEDADLFDISKRRQIEEVRLYMSAEANLTLLRKGYQIETAPLEELVEKLKEAERQFYRPVLEETSENGRVDTDEDMDAKINIFKSARRIIEVLPAAPVRVVADVASEGDITLGKIDEKSSLLKAQYDKANESYEALMTAPRADMGDSIRKAFGNVDDILNDMGMDINESNRKAVRTLGYAQMPITSQSVDEIRKATMAVQRVAELMTPAKTLQMIREGHNPLEEDIYELEDKLSRQSVAETSEKYSEFLWNLEKKGQITEDEKSAYIGMYRLLHQIEKQDGRVVGNVLSNGQELTMANMLAASRSNRHKNMDVRIDDDFGLLDELVTKEESITSQIEKGFVQIISQPMSAEYIKERTNEIRKSLKSESEAGKILEKLDQPVTIENIMAVTDMIDFGGKATRRLFGDDKEKDKSTVEGRKITGDGANDEPVMTNEDARNLVDDFTDKESAEAAYEKYIEKAMEIAEKRTENADKYIDVRQWAMIHKQLGFAASMSQKETYDIPLLTDNGYTSIHLSIVHNSQETGKVTLDFETQEYGKVSAAFALRQDGLDAFVVSDSRSGVNSLSDMQETFVNAFSREGISTSNMSIVYSRTAQTNDYVAEGSEATNSQLYRLARAFIMALQNEKE